MKIKSRLVTINLVIGALVLVGGILASSIIDNTAKKHHLLVSVTAPKLQALDNILLSGLRIISSTSEYGFIAAETKASNLDIDSSHDAADEEKELYSDGKDNLLFALSNYNEIYMDSGHQHTPDFLINIKKICNELIRISAIIISLKKDDVSGKSVLDAKEDFEDLEEKFTDIIEKEIEAENLHLNLEDKELEISIATSSYMIKALSVTLALISVIMAWLQSHKIVSPILKIEKAAKRFGQGSSLSEIDIDYSSNDEIGSLSTTLKNMMADEERLTTDLKQSKDVAVISNQSKSEFLSNMSHELRTPMHAIISFSSLGERKLGTASEEKLMEYFTSIHQSGERLLVLINDLLDLSKLESGHMDFDLQKNDLIDVVNSAESELHELLNNKSLDLKMNIPISDTTAYFDRDKIFQVIINLLSNAIKFSPENKSIIVSIDNSSLPNGSRRTDVSEVPAICVSVSDEGVGIPGDELELIFDKFSQSTKTKTGGGGTGLGLAICKQIIEGHKGSIQARNDDISGATVTFVIPRMSMLS